MTAMRASVAMPPIAIPIGAMPAVAIPDENGLRRCAHSAIELTGRNRRCESGAASTDDPKRAR